MIFCFHKYHTRVKMKVDQNTRLKREQIEVNIVELLKYILSKALLIILISVVFAVAIPTVKYISDKNSAKDMQNELNQGVNATTKLQDYIDRLDIYEKIYLSELEYRENSILMQLDYKKINEAVLQFNVNASEEHVFDVVTAVSSYGTDGGLFADIYKVDNAINEEYLSEIIKVAGSGYSSSEVSAVISVKIYGLNEESCKKYAGLVTNALLAYSDVLQTAGIENNLVKYYESYAVIQDTNVWNSQKNHNTTVSEILTDISNLEITISTLRNQGYMSADEVQSGMLLDNVTFEFKYVILGFAVGVILAILVIAVKYIVSEKIKYEREFWEISGVDYIGNISKRSNDVQLDRLYYKIKSMCELCNTDKVTFIGDFRGYDKKVLSDFNKSGLTINDIGDVVNDVEALKKFEINDNVIITVSENITSYRELEELVKLCAVKQSNVLGYIYIN